MYRQLAAVRGWDAVLAPQNAAMLASGSTDLEPSAGQMCLAFVYADIDEAIETLPANIQTIGYASNTRALTDTWLGVLERTQIKRLVPLAKMHHFGPVWDGHAFWRQAFDEVEVAR